MKLEEAIRLLEILKNNNGLLNIEPLNIEEFEEAIQQGISALEKQVARNVQKWENGTNHCPNEDCYYNEFELPYQHEFKHCPECGQKLDWSEI